MISFFEMLNRSSRKFGKIMKFNILSIIYLAVAVMMTGCVDDDLPLCPGDEDFISPLQFSVNAFSVNGDDGTRSAEPSANPEPESEQEKKIYDFWLFQFNPDGTKLTEPVHYDVPEGQLSQTTADAYSQIMPDVPMTIFVVTNVGGTWPDVVGCNTLEEVKNAKLPSPYAIRVLADGNRTDPVRIPMQGQVDNVTKTDNSLIVVPVTRMYAKLKIKADFNVEDMVVYDVMVENIPFYCRVKPLAGEKDPATGEPAAVPFPENTTLLKGYGGFSAEDAVEVDDNGNYWMVIYVPENIQGEIPDADKKTLTNIPQDALFVDIRAKYNSQKYNYKVYPGENSTNNFNIRRNCVYRVNVEVNSVENQHIPSSNCFVVEPGDKLTFEPYYRVETGGGYRIEDYLNPNDEDKKIAGMEIIWQTKDCIGDNSNYDLVTFELDEKEPIHSKITVHQSREGNALIGARNAAGDIIWSWHIWVTHNQPDNFREAIVYKTYAWDENGIKSDKPRIPGYGVMPCNLGALEYISSVSDLGTGRNHPRFPEDQLRTFGMMYQWGRKDPFPPLARLTEDTYSTASWLDYTDENTEIHYDNANQKSVGKTSGTDANYLFHTVNGPETVRYSIGNPTVYIAVGTPRNSMLGINPDDADYRNGGDWCTGENGTTDRLWGGLNINDLINMKKLLIERNTEAGDIYLYDNYGTEKSIFDPCPTGWRVAPPDLWLGFTKTGLNPSVRNAYDMNEINYDRERTNPYGMSMFMREWGGGPSSYFPTQGTLCVNGRGYHAGRCGNYHNATCVENRVNILHIHNNSLLSWQASFSGGHFHIFEYDYKNYYYKSTAGPVRCVRDKK